VSGEVLRARDQCEAQLVVLLDSLPVARHARSM
jgi:hypothetical protein